MTWYFPLHTPIFAVNVVVSAWIAILAWRHGKDTSSKVFAVMLLASAFWSFWHLFEIGVDQDWARITFSKIQYLGAVVVGPSWLIFTCYYSKRVRHFPVRYVLLMAIVPVITVVLAWTNEFHHLIWTTITPSPLDPRLLIYGHGIWFWIAIAYNHIFVFLGTWFVFRVAQAAPKGQRSQAQALLVGALVPICGSLLYITGLSPIHGEDLTISFLFVTGIIYLLAVLRFRLFDVRRVARAAIIDNMRDGMLIIDEKHHLIDVNPSALKLLSVPNTILRQDVRVSLSAYPTIVDIIQFPRPQSITVMIGDDRHLDIQVSELNDSLGKPAGKLVVLRDVTERISAEKIAFETAIEQHRLRLLTQFLRDISHEFRTPLSVINTSLYIMEKSADPTQQKHRREIIQLQSNRLDSLISEMLISVQLDTNSSLEPTLINLSDLLQTVIQEQMPAMKAKQQQISANLPPASVYIVGDSFMLQKALSNILQNASRYTPDGGTLTVAGTEASETTTITITDSGMGMSDETKSRIFERFFRADDSHSTPGFGLGLPIAQSIIEKHHGHIGVESVLGTGTTFTIRLPQTKSETSTLPILQAAQT
jgi:signal transduction histidine kinase